MTSDRPATAADVDEICAGLPETEFGTSWGDVPTWKVPAGERGRGFLLYRRPGATAIDPATGEPFDDLLVITTPGMEAKEALVADETTPFFTVEHLRRSAAVLVQQSRLGELSYAELVEVITDAWAARAPGRLTREHLRTDPAGG